MAHYIAYLRVSTQRQKNSGLGIEAQRAIIEYYAKIDQAIIVREVVESVSGKETGNRPQLRAAITECVQHGYTLVVAKLDRLSRDVQDTFQILKALEGRLKSCDIPQLDSFTLAIFAGLAQRERELISIRTKAALAEKKKRGFQLGTPANLTIDNRKTGILAAAEKATKHRSNRLVLALVEKCRREHKTLPEIARELDESGFRTVRGKKHSIFSVRRLLKPDGCKPSARPIYESPEHNS
ncbi:recombinase family protein [Dyadobacter sp. BHUBP1]|uniref:recombinase family protein n=1 Tax=Dyadobacter sp. BHUBP1 TaxID=3424178 RepID=UPI003D35337E